MKLKVLSDGYQIETNGVHLLSEQLLAGRHVILVGQFDWWQTTTQVSVRVWSSRRGTYLVRNRCIALNLDRQLVMYSAESASGASLICTNLAAMSLARCATCRTKMGSARLETSLCVPIGLKSGMPSALCRVTLNQSSRSQSSHSSSWPRRRCVPGALVSVVASDSFHP